jgi:hypothetical protein
VESVVVDNIPETKEANITSPDASVKVAVRFERGLGVINVEGLQVLKTDNLVEFGHGCGICGRSADVIAGSEDVAGVHADADAVLVHDELE